MLERDQDPIKKDPGQDPPGALEGEGSTSAAKKYDEELDEFKKESDIEQLAEEAAREVDDEDQPGANEEGTGRKVA